MINFENPFRQFRAEQMGRDLWEYYVPGPFERLLTPRPLVLEGGRGSGKTMFFLCNSWQEKSKMLRAKGQPITDLLLPNESVGVYYKVDTAFVTAMEGKDRGDWDGIFGTYFAACISREILLFVERVVTDGFLQPWQVKDICLEIGKLMANHLETPDLSSAINCCDSILDEVESVINSDIVELSIHKTVIGRVISKIIDKLRRIDLFSEVTIRIFIDEYETLLESQQRLINTLIKHSHVALIYNVGMRPKGMLTNRTSSETEIIQAPHDYNLYKPESVFNPEDGESRQQYQNLLKQVCAKRIEHFCKIHGYTGDISSHIDYYLGEYSVDEEINEIVDTRKVAPFLDRLVKVIGSLEANEEKTEYYVERLAKNVPVLNARLHLCLLLRSKAYRPSLETLVMEYEAWTNRQSKKYDDWLHNTKLGLVFLLAKEYKRSKMYYGFEVYTMLSSGVIRYFLELCEQAFDAAIDDGFSWENPRPITPHQQTKAARYVSRYKIKDIEGYEPYGRSLRIFVQSLGDTFRELHRNPDLTLGEPEPNHFCTNDFKLDTLDYDAKKVLDSAVMWTVLQERHPTKEKVSDAPEIVDYHLNHIYCPYFEISYRKKRKLFIQPGQLRGFLKGNEDDAKRVIKELTSKPNAFRERTDKEEELKQLSIFDGDV